MFVRPAASVRNRPATEPVILKVCNIKLKFDIWLVLWIAVLKGYVMCCGFRALTVLWDF